jgi:hypothetical protein
MMRHNKLLAIMALTVTLVLPVPVGAQSAPPYATANTNVALDSDLVTGGGTSVPANPMPAPVPAPVPVPASVGSTAPSSAGSSYQKDDVVGAAEGVFGKGAEGLASLIEKILKDQGQPNAYITGREAGAAIGLGLRYGSGTLNHKVEGQRKVYWTGPSLGFDIGGNASKTFVLVYNLYDSQDLYKRYPAGEGAAYIVGGFTASYLRRDDVVLIPIRMGVGWRLGVNAGYMKFSEKGRIIPF